jgi:hypothetical protein
MSGAGRLDPPRGAPEVPLFGNEEIARLSQIPRAFISLSDRHQINALAFRCWINKGCDQEEKT